MKDVFVPDAKYEMNKNPQLMLVRVSVCCRPLTCLSQMYSMDVQEYSTCKMFHCHCNSL